MFGENCKRCAHRMMIIAALVLLLAGGAVDGDHYSERKLWGRS
ncbi:MAG: hypothetical protein Q7U60_03115 [Candidatus Methanoperedens sp.]|nr:hypothetical protein [Candidatus Methanoperedens sp.]